MAIGLKLTKAAILAYLKKNRKRLQIWEAKKNLKKGITEKVFLQRDPQVRAGMGKISKPIKGVLSRAEQRFGDILGELPTVKKVRNVLDKEMASSRRKVTSAAKKYRKKGGKLSDYKEPNPVYKRVEALRKLKRKQKTGSY